MAEEQQDKSEKTEEPTEHKLNKARDKGQVPRSQEVNHFFMLLAIATVVAFSLPVLLGEIFNLFGGVFTEIGTLKITRGDLIPLVWQLAKIMAIALVPSFLVFMAFGLFGALIQTGGPLLSAEPIKPKLNKISPAKGAKKLFSMKSMVDFLKSLVKMAVLGSVVWVIVYRHRDVLIDLPYSSIGSAVLFNQQVFLEMVIGVLVIAAIMAILDYMYQRFEFMKEQRMSKKEIKDETKETVGDPQIKQRQQQIRQERASMRMMEEVPKANVVVTNPTHYAIALAYEQGVDDAPRVLAKGVDHLAMGIRERAEDYNIPIVEDPPLARALYAQAEPGEEIPLELYEAVARVISYVFNLKKGQAGSYRSALNG